MRDRKVVLKALILVFLIYLGVFFACFLGYLKYRADKIKLYTSLGWEASEVKFAPWWTWEHFWMLPYAGLSIVFAIIIAASERMYKRKFKIASSYALASLGCGFAVVIRDIWRIKVQLDQLYWIAENTHSGMVYVMIDWVEADLRLRLTNLWILMAVTAFVVCGLIGIYWRSRGATHKRVLQTMASLFLVLALLMPAVTAEVTRYYARVQMYVPQQDHLTKVSGYITPHPAGAVNLWVCHHIGVGFQSSVEWIGGGYEIDEEIGTIFYIEWVVGGVYREITAPSVVFDEQILVEVYELEQGWEASVYDSYGSLVLQESVTELPTGEMTRGIAGGESIDTCNRMESSFSGLWWRIATGQSGLWTGFPYTCTVMHGAPYEITIEVPYYDFTVSGGYGKTLVVSTSAGGTTDPEAGAYTYTQGSNVTVKATPNSWYTFEYWHLDGTTNYENPIDVTMNSDHTLDPVFKYQPPGWGPPPSGPPRDEIWGKEP